MVAPPAFARSHTALVRCARQRQRGTWTRGFGQSCSQSGRRNSKPASFPSPPSVEAPRWLFAWSNAVATVCTRAHAPLSTLRHGARSTLCHGARGAAGRLRRSSCIHAYMHTYAAGRLRRSSSGRARRLRGYKRHAKRRHPLLATSGARAPPPGCAAAAHAYPAISFRRSPSSACGLTLGGVWPIAAGTCRRT